jgi:hypothetical protein
MLRAWATARIDWRSPARTWGVLGWLAAVLWPPLAVTLIIFPPTVEAGGFGRDWRTTALAVAAISCAVTLRLIAQERRRDSTPDTRLGVILRFLAYGFFFAIAAHVLLVLSQAVFALIDVGDPLRRLGEAKAAMLIGVVSLPATLIIGVSHALWAGVVACLVAFKPRATAARSQHFLYERMMPTPEAAPPGEG